MSASVILARLRRTRYRRRHPERVREQLARWYQKIKLDPVQLAQYRERGRRASHRSHAKRRVDWAELSAYAARIAGTFRCSVDEREDLISGSLVAIMQAWKTYDPRKGASFKTHAATRVRGWMIDRLEYLNRRRVEVQLTDEEWRKAA